MGKNSLCRVPAPFSTPTQCDPQLFVGKAASDEMDRTPGKKNGDPGTEATLPFSAIRKETTLLDPAANRKLPSGSLVTWDRKALLGAGNGEPGTNSKWPSPETVNTLMESGEEETNRKLSSWLKRTPPAPKPGMLNGEPGICVKLPVGSIRNTSSFGSPEELTTKSRLLAQLVSNEPANVPGGFPSGKGDPGTEEILPSRAISNIPTRPPRGQHGTASKLTARNLPSAVTVRSIGIRPGPTGAGESNWLSDPFSATRKMLMLPELMFAAYKRLLSGEMAKETPPTPIPPVENGDPATTVRSPLEESTENALTSFVSPFAAKRNLPFGVMANFFAAVNPPVVPVPAVANGDRGRRVRVPSELIKKPETVLPPNSSKGNTSSFMYKNLLWAPEPAANTTDSTSTVTIFSLIVARLSPAWIRVKFTLSEDGG
jgi:hypothetical protein